MGKICYNLKEISRNFVRDMGNVKKKLDEIRNEIT